MPADLPSEERRVRWRSDIADRTIGRNGPDDSSEQRSEHPKMRTDCEIVLFQGGCLDRFSYIAGQKRSHTRLSNPIKHSQ